MRDKGLDKVLIIRYKRTVVPLQFSLNLYLKPNHLKP
jgi:hypothetical protein